MNIQQFGQTIKQKYPQYQNVPDEELGTQMLEKYPQYKSKIDTTSAPTAPEKQGSLGNTLASLVGFGENGILTNFGKDVGAGLGMRTGDGQAMQQAQSNALSGAEAARQKAMTTTDPEAQRRLLAVSGQAAETVGQGSSDINSQFSPDIDKGYVGRGMGVGAQIATTADLVNFLTGSPAVGAFKNTKMNPWLGVGPTSAPSIIGRVSGAIKAIKNIKNPIKGVGGKLSESRKAVNIPTSDLEEGILDSATQNREYSVGTTEFKRKIDNAIARALQPTGGWREVQEGVSTRIGAPKLTNLDEVFKNLNALKKSTPTEVYSTVSDIMRDYINPLQTPQGLKLEKTYSTLKKVSPFVKRFGLGAAASAGAAIAGPPVYQLGRKLFGYK